MFISVVATLALLYSQAASLVSAAAVEVEARGQSGGFNLYQSLGNLSPYHKGPIPHGIEEVLPGDCTVDQVMLVRFI